MIVHKCKKNDLRVYKTFKSLLKHTSNSLIYVYCFLFFFLPNILLFWGNFTIRNISVQFL